MNIAIIPARGGSTRIPRKNIRPFAGRPMLEWPVEVARVSGLFEQIIVSTDDEEVADIARSARAEVPFMRPAELADNHCGTLEVIAHATRWAMSEHSQLDSVCCLYPTAAFTTVDDLTTASELRQGESWDYVFAAGKFDKHVQRAFVRADGGGISLLFPEHRLKRTQDLPDIFYDAGQFYWGAASAWAEYRPMFGERTSFIELPSSRAIDIDTEKDWAIAEEQFIEWKQHDGE